MLRLAVRLTLAQHPIACLGEVPGDGDYGSPVSLAGSESSIEQADVAFAIGAQMRRAGGGLDERPLEIAVDVATGAAVTDMAARGDDARHEAGVAGQIFGSGKRSMSPISNHNTGARILPTPGSVWSS